MSRLLHRIVSRRAKPDDAGSAGASGEPAADGASGEPAAEEPRRPRAGERARARRRLRYLRQLRDLQLRDLGGFVLDLYRFGERRDHLVREKLDAIIASDKERHALEALLDDRRPTHEVRQPGVGGTCQSCGELHASDARFCSRCGADLAAPAPRLRAVEDSETVELAAVRERRRRAES